MSFLSVFMNGAYLTQQEASFPLLDLSITRGYSIFATMRTYRQIPFQAPRHVEKLLASANLLGIDIPYKAVDFYTIFSRLIPSDKTKEWIIKIIITGGCSSGLQVESTPNVCVYIQPFIDLPSSYYQEGVVLSTLQYERYLPEIKSTNYLPAILAYEKKRSFFEVLYLSKKNELLEAATSNFFLVKKGQLFTAATGIFPGVTREVILTLLPCVQGPIFYHDLEQAEEVFITSTNKGILPVKQIDNYIFAVGPVTRHLQQLWKDYIKSDKWLDNNFLPVGLVCG